MPERPKGFGAADVRRLGDVVRYVESVPRAGGIGPGRAPRSGQVASCWARLTSAISARSGAQCYSGTAYLCSVSATGVFSDTAVEVTVWNGTEHGFTSGSGRYCKLDWANGKWWVDVPGSCDFLS